MVSGVVSGVGCWHIGCNTFSRCVTQDSRLGPSEACAIHPSLQIPRLYHIQGIDRIKMADEMLNRKLLEKQRVQNRSASYEVHIGHFFLQCQCYCQFWKSFNPVYIQISKFFTGQTDWQMDKTNCLTPSRMRTRGNEWYHHNTVSYCPTPWAVCQIQSLWLDKN